MFKAAARIFPVAAAAGFGYASHVAWMRGFADAGRERMRQGLAEAADLDNPFEFAFARYLAAMLLLFLRDFQEAKAAAAAAVALSDEHGFLQFAASARIFLGVAEAACGDPGSGIPRVTLGLRGIDNIGARIATTLFLSWFAEVLALDGKVQEALETVEQALQVNPAELAWRPDALRIRGELRSSLAQTDAAESDFREAIALAQKIGAKAWELRGAMSLARLLKARGDSTTARKLLVPIYNWFTEGFDTADLKDAKALLDELSA
jgi:tetratricopeptide (TPR) repeat protein